MQNVGTYVSHNPVMVGVAALLLLVVVVAIVKQMLKLMVFGVVALAAAIGFGYVAGGKMASSPAALARQATERLVDATTKDLPPELRTQVQRLVAEKLASGVRPDVLVDVLRQQLTAISGSKQALTPAQLRARLEAALNAAKTE